MNLPAESMFTVPEDGWFQLSAVGEFPHASTGLTQILDEDAIAAIVQAFTEDAAKPNFPGVLVDWDHASLDLDKPTEAAGWIVAVQKRPDGLWGQIRWSDRGAEAVRGGRYRFISPVWRQEDCLDLGEKRVRPLRLFNCALTNDPNIKGMVPLANSGRPLTDEQRKAIFAKSGGSPGAGTSSPGSTSPTPPSYAPPKPPTNPAITALNKLKDELETYRTDRPTPPPSREEVDPKAVRNELLRIGRPLNEATDAERAAETRNKAIREERREFNWAMKKAGKSPEQTEKAWAAKLEKEKREYGKALTAWETRDARISKEQAKLDVQIGKEEAAQDRRDQSALTAQQKEEARRQEQAAKEQVARDKEEARRLLDEQKKAERDAERDQRIIRQDAEKNEPQRVYRAQLTKRRTYWDALARGDQAYAERIYPGADHQANTESMKAVSGWKDKVAKLRDMEPK